MAERPTPAAVMVNGPASSHGELSASQRMLSAVSGSLLTSLLGSCRPVNLAQVEADHDVVQ